MELLLQLLKPFWIKIAKWGGVLITVLFILFKVRQSGKETVEFKQAVETLKAVKTHDKIERDINTSDDDTINKLYEQELKRD